MNRFHGRPLPHALLAVAFITGSSVSADAATKLTPIPGGANQLKGVSGKLTSTLFNGHLRIRKMQLRLSTADEASPRDGQRAITLTYVVSNGTSRELSGYFNAVVADADGDAVDESIQKSGTFFDLIPAASARGKNPLIVPSDFKPVKIILTNATDAEPVFRISLQPSDIPAVAPVMSPSP